MIEILLRLITTKHPGRGSYEQSDCKIYKKALQDKPYKMHNDGRHPWNIVYDTHDNQ